AACARSGLQAARIQGQPVLPDRPAPADARVHHCLLGDSAHDGRTPAVHAPDHRLYPDRGAVLRGTRLAGRARRQLSAIPAEGTDDLPVAAAEAACKIGNRCAWLTCAAILESNAMAAQNANHAARCFCGAVELE